VNHSRDMEILKVRAEAVQVVVTEVPDLAQAWRYAVELTQKQGGAAIAAPGWDPENLAALEKECLQAGLGLYRQNLRDQAAGFHTGLTRADWGIAATGTLVLDLTSEDLRLATMLCETHVAVLPRSRLKPDSLSLEAELEKFMEEPPRYLAFITGASRTADIERVLTLGVHGPLELHLLILED
jgi:L-lactate dehydrogenase complex protein LldG